MFSASVFFASLITALFATLPDAHAQASSQAVGESPAAATTSDFKWLEGQWEGRMTGGVGVAHVMFGPPAFDLR